MAKILIHIVAHKTATSSIQWTLRENKAYFEGTHNISIITPTQFLDLDIKKHFQKLASRQGFSDKLEFSKSIKAAKNSIEPLLHPNKYNVISYEGFMGHSNLAEYEGLYNPTIGNSLREIFADHNLKVILTIRRQDEFINSCYLQQVKESKKLSFEDFTARIPATNISWTRITNELEISLGENNLLVLTMEFVSHVGILEFIAQMLEFFNNSKIKIDQNLKTFYRNNSISKLGVDIYDLMRQHLDKKNRAIIAQILYTHFSSRKFGKHNFFTEFSKNAIIQNCIQSNAEIFTKNFNKLSRDSFLDSCEHVKKHYGIV